jgi:hypothetical protein
MKRLHHDVTMSMIATPILMFPFAWMANKWLQGKLSPLNQDGPKEVWHPVE